MSRTLLTSREIGNVQRNDLDVATTGEAVISKVVQGTDISISSTGADAGTGDVTINAGANVITTTNTKTLTNKTIGAGTTSVPPLQFTAGTNLTTPVDGAHEYDGALFYRTPQTTNGRMNDAAFNIFRLTANGSALGPTIADFFGSNSAIPTVANAVYRLTFYCYYVKSTAGTVTFTLTNTQQYTYLNTHYTHSPAGGIGTNAAMTTAGLIGATAAASAFPPTPSLSNGLFQIAVISALVEVGTAGNIRLRVTSSAGTVTPQRGSYFTVELLGTTNIGTFAA